MTTPLHTSLHQYFGFNEFRQGQQQTIEQLLNFTLKNLQVCRTTLRQRARRLKLSESSCRIRWLAKLKPRKNFQSLINNNSDSNTS